jgi:hypothetical protein
MERKRGCKRGCLLEANNEAGLLLIQVCKKKSAAGLFLSGRSFFHFHKTGLS